MDAPGQGYPTDPTRVAGRPTRRTGEHVPPHVEEEMGGATETETKVS